MNDLVRVLFLALTLFSAIAPVHAASKERLVLMPLRLAEDDRALQGVMEAALVEGLQQKYKVYSGEEVAQKAKAIFDKESKTTKKECDETRCMEDIGMAFNSELIATATVQKQSDGYFLALKIQDIVDNTVVYSKSMPCEGCNRYAVVDKLKELVGSSSAPSAPVAVAAPKIDSNNAEDQLWQAVSQSNTVEDYQVYLDTYPKGKFVALVKARLKKIQDDAAAAKAQKEKQSWDDAQKQNSESAYNAFMQQYPASTYVALARVRLNKLKADAEIGVTEAEVKTLMEKFDKASSEQNADSLSILVSENAKLSGTIIFGGSEQSYNVGKAEFIKNFKESSSQMSNYTYRVDSRKISISLGRATVIDDVFETGIMHGRQVSIKSKATTTIELINGAAMFTQVVVAAHVL